MPTVSSRIATLPAEQRDELQAILAEARAAKPRITDRFQSNADEASFPFYVLLAGAVVGLVAYVVVFGNPFVSGVAGWLEVFRNPASLQFAFPHLLAQLALPVAAYSVWRVVANFRANGWALTSFGFAHVTRTTVRYITYSDIVAIDVHRGTVGRSRRSYTAYTLTGRDGGKVKAYAGRLLDELEKRLPADAKRTSW